ncbi:uncharacterized protein LOC115675807 [Syzygium oleosum]|uniref:uncharacterized protein LOC115675807 n=1 Tax=Syzygium oleosum TaxID=219896 RepID=UPI0024BB501E|nr:uncharacterized protein LOC115675807 [Syzygium oleosum]
MALELAKDSKPKRPKRYKRFDVGGIGFDTYGSKYLIIKVPSSRVLMVLARALALAFIITSFSWLKSGLKRSVDPYRAISEVNQHVSDPVNLVMLPLLFQDLANEGLLKSGNSVALLSNGYEESIDTSIIPGSNEMDRISITDLERQSSIPSDTFAFAFTTDYTSSAEFIDRTLKVGGVAAILLSKDPNVQFDVPPNYKIAYIRKFESTVLAIRKTGERKTTNSATQRRLCGFAPEEKKAALQNLEDVLLEPPRAASRRSRAYFKRTRYLPDLMGDSLESYPRRVFIDVGLPERDGGASSTAWFARNYPTRNLDFEMYKIETVAEEPGSTKEKEKEAEAGAGWAATAAQVGMSDWLKKNVREEEYVVMKAEAEVVEEMVRSKAIGLVDELFLECKPEGVKRMMMMSDRSRRAYWECLALYGRLRDEGVAVHQWWG